MKAQTIATRLEAKVLYVIISLPRAPERRVHMESQLAQAGISGQAEFFSAIDGQQFRVGKESGGYSPAEVRRLSRWVPYLRHKGFLWNQAGCFLSHKEVWKQLIEDTKHDFYVVLEDDAYLHPEIRTVVEALTMRADTNFVRLATIQTAPVQAKVLCDLPASHRLMMEYGPHPQGKLIGKNALHTNQILRNWLFGAMGYLLSREAATILLKHTPDIRRPLDDQMQRFWEHNLPPMVVHPHLVRTDTKEIPSTIAQVGDKFAYAKKQQFAVLPFYSASPRNLACRSLQIFLRRRDVLRYRRSVSSLMDQFGYSDLSAQPSQTALSLKSESS